MAENIEPGEDGNHANRTNVRRNVIQRIQPIPTKISTDPLHFLLFG